MYLPFIINVKRILIIACVIVCFATLPAFAQDPKILDYNKENKTIKVEIDGKEYTLDVPVETPPEVINETTVEEGDILKGKVKKKRYAVGPASSNVGARVYNIPTDNLLPRNGIKFDFTHRFSGPIREDTANDLYGLDTFARTGIGLYYGITDFLEAHAFRTSLTDASEVGLKVRLLREAKTWGEGSPIGLTLSGGFQNDNIQNSLDFFIQPIITKVILPKWAKVYLAPTWADHSSTIGKPGSKSASFFQFQDPKNRKPARSPSTFALPIGLVAQIWPNKLSLFGEYTPILGGYREVENGWAFGLQILSKLETHVWTIGISNVPYSTFGQFIVGGPSNDWFIGFNITARMK